MLSIIFCLDQNENMWYACDRPDGTQLWASVRIQNSEIQNCGLNQVPRIADIRTGLSRSSRPIQGKK